MLVVTTTHSNIPATSQSDQELTKNHTGSQEPAVVRLPAGPSTSSLLQVKANGKSPTIATPSITALRQSRPPTTEFQAAVTNERPVGTGEQALNAPPAFTALRSPCLTGSFEGIASVEAVISPRNLLWEKRLPYVCQSVNLRYHQRGLWGRNLSTPRRSRTNQNRVSAPNQLPMPVEMQGDSRTGEC